MAWQHRPALDGLRTVAVYLVVCFHAQVGWASGGFIGVDLFFVLSGFLVASILLEERYTTGRIHLVGFFARRIRRLLPAATVVVVATSLVFLLVAPVVRRLDWVADAQSALLYVANWRFLHASNDYFTHDPTQSPFVHFWSLAVEEQFYLAFPFVLLGLISLKKWWRPALVAGISALLAASVLAQLFWAAHDTNHAYYGTDARIYQPLAGVLAAIAWRHLAARKRALRRSGWVLLAGLVLIGSSAVDWSASTRGLAATAISAVLVLAVMTRNTPSLDKALSVPQVTYLGRISYGTYLWHWPVLLLVTSGLDAPAWVDCLITATVATGLAALSYELLEHPLRRLPLPTKLPGATVLTGLTCSVLVAYTVVPVVLKNDARPRLTVASSGSTYAPLTAGGSGESAPVDAVDPNGPVPPIDFAAIHDSRGAETSYCTLSDTTRCIAHHGSSGLHVMLVGDSHARVFAPSLERIAEERDFTLSYSMVASCPWQGKVVSKWATADERSDCLRARSALYGGLLQAMDVDVVVLAELPRASSAWRDRLVSTTGSSVGLDALNRATITESLQSVEHAGARAVTLDAWLVPRDDFDPLACLAGARSIGQCRVTTAPAPNTDGFVHAFADRSAGVASININDLVCPTQPVCEPVLDGLPVWRDDKHYSTEILLDHVEQIRDRLLATGYFG
jgi:peptidoglycan/LPS O-acetylase OafA/YrhL